MPDDDQTYVVIRVEMQAEQNWERSYEGFFDDDTAASGNASAQQSQKFDAIPRQTANGKYYPPVLPGKPFRQSGPLPAYVIDSGIQVTEYQRRYGRRCRGWRWKSECQTDG